MHPHMHTDEHLVQGSWGGPLLRACSERHHPSRDQQTAVNPLLKILANPLGLLRIASGHCVCHKSGIMQRKAVNGAPTPDLLFKHKHKFSWTKGGFNCAVLTGLSTVSERAPDKGPAKVQNLFAELSVLATSLVKFGNMLNILNIQD